MHKNIYLWYFIHVGFVGFVGYVSVKVCCDTLKSAEFYTNHCIQKAYHFSNYYKIRDHIQIFSEFEYFSFF